MTLAELQRLARRIAPDSRVVRSWALSGGMSSQMTAFEVELSTRSKVTWVMRRPSDWALGRNPRAAADEHRLLRLLRAHGLPVPEPLFAGQDAATPNGCLVLTYVPGEPSFDPPDPFECVRKMAVLLSEVHRIDDSTVDLSFLRDGTKAAQSTLERPSARLDDGLGEGQIRAALKHHVPARRQPMTLLHGDFWPGNLLWRDGRCVALIDWEDAARGDPLMDLAVARLDVCWAFGVDAMQAFTAHYQTLTRCDLIDLAAWDLHAALRPAGVLDLWARGWAAFGRTDVTVESMRATHRAFVAAALERLPPTR